MPIHEYCCHKCNKEFEEIVLSSDETVVCPECGSDRVEKFMSACKFRTGGPIVSGSPSANAVTSRGKSGCAGCSGGNCSTC
ncbi:MAG: FmdB family zinc ribbon protein [Desulfonatronovibrionaceae bacterium]